MKRFDPWLMAVYLLMAFLLAWNAFAMKAYFDADIEAFRAKSECQRAQGVVHELRGRLERRDNDRDYPWFVVKSGKGSDGTGLNVNACIETLALNTGVRDLGGFHEWSMKQSGGSYPAKLDAQLKRYCQETGKPVPSYLSSENLPWPRIVAATEQGHPCLIAVNGAVPHYSNHVHTAVILVKVQGRLAWIIDPNFPELGKFTVPTDALEKAYQAAPWAVFLAANAHDLGMLSATLEK